MSFMKSGLKRDRSRSSSGDRDSYDRGIHSKMERSRYSSKSSGSRKVYVSNINFECSFQDLKDKFNTVGEVSFVQMLKDDKDKRFKGCAVVSFKEPQMAQDAIEHLNRQEFKGRKLVVKEEDANPDYKSPDRKRSRDDMEIRNIGSTLNQSYNLYGLSMTFLDSLKIDLPLVDTVFVANLDYDVEDKHLKEVFSLAGNVIDCEIFKDKEGKSRGFGIVEYEHPVEAVQAISMLHNQSYRDRALTVRMDRSDRQKDKKPRLPLGLKSVGLGLGVDGSALKDIKTNPLMNQVQPISPLSAANSGISSLGLATQLTQLSQNASSGGLIDSLPIGGRVGGLASSLGNSSLSISSNRDYNSGYTPTLGNIIEITNLPFNYSNIHLRKLGWTYGDVRFAEMRSEGAGMIKFTSKADAQRAVDMLDQQPLDGRVLCARVL